mgnify:CR=1 FL=1
MAYLAFLSDDSITSSIPKNLQYVLDEEGAMSLTTMEGRWLSYKYYFIPYLDYAKSLMESYTSFITQYFVYLNPFSVEEKPFFDKPIFLPYKDSF